MLTPILLAASLFAAAPAPMDVTETVVLKYWSAGQFEDLLLHNGGSRARRGVGGGLGAPENIMPAGIRAWTVDEEHNRLTFIGDEAGVTAVKNLVRLLDVRPRQISIQVRFLRANEAPDPQGPLFRSLDEAAVAGLKPEENTRGWTLTVANNRPLRFRGPALDAGAADSLQEIMPRVNGDGTLTLLLTSVPARASQPADADGLNVIRRVSSGQGIAIAFPRQGKVMRVWATLLPDDPAADAAK